MGRFLWSQLLHRKSRTATLGLGILVAAVGFTMLTAAADTGAVRVRGTIEKNFRSAYDILVRPADSYTPLEREQGLVAPNFASGIFGGISLRQWQTIRSIPGVEVAAPIANIGYVVPYSNVKLLVNPYLTGRPWQLYRIRSTLESNNGLSEYPEDDQYVYYMARDRVVGGHFSGPYEELPNGRQVGSCYGFNKAVPAALGPFIRGASSALHCFSARSPVWSARNEEFGFKPGEVGTPLFAPFPIMMAAVDPEQEDRLVGLDEARVTGRRLTADLPVISLSKPFSMLKIPVIASTRDFIADDLRVDIERLKVPQSSRLPATLASTQAYSYLTHQEGVPLGTRTYRASSLYERDLRLVVADTYWTASPVRYQGRVGDQIEAVETTNPDRTYQIPSSGFLYDPANHDVQFRHVTNHPAGELYPEVEMNVVGRYDPFKLRGFSPLSRIPLAAYAPPVVSAATVASRKALGGHPLQPTMNFGGYVQQPPLMLTTLDAARELLDSSRFSGASGSKPISVIRVLVAGVTGPDPESLARIKAVSQLIAERTGLAVDITAGSSPTTVRVHLPAGKFGSPALDLDESWVKKGVAVVILQALDRKSVALFVLVLIVTGLLLVNGALASVKTRRAEIGTLLALGWSRERVFRAVLGELALVGLAAGVVGTAIAALLVTVFDFQMPLARTLLVAPVAAVLATLAGLPPAWRAARGLPLDAVRPAVLERGSSHHVHTIAAMSLANLRRLPSRTLLGAAGLVIGTGALALLLSITLAFQGSLVGTALGKVITIQVRRVDYIGVFLALGLAALSVTDVLFLNQRERAPELVTLRASGWRDSHLARLVALEGLGIGVLGSVVGVAVGVALSSIVGVSAGGLAQAAGIALAVGIAVALAGSLVPASLIARMTTPTVLAEE